MVLSHMSLFITVMISIRNQDAAKDPLLSTADMSVLGTDTYVSATVKVTRYEEPAYHS
jgi:hypothetical protein